MKLPEVEKRVLAWVDGEQYPFVGYITSNNLDEFGQADWKMEVGYLNCDTHRNDVFGTVTNWVELPENHPNT